MSKAAPWPLAVADPYRTDFHARAPAQARALGAREDSALDLVNSLDKVESLGRSRRHAIESHLEVLIAHLFEFRIQPERASPSGRRTLSEQRRRIARLVERNPSLRSAVPMLVAEIYPSAKARAVLESGLFDDTFSEGCPFLEEEILTAGFYPDPYGDDAIRGEGLWKRAP